MEPSQSLLDLGLKTPEKKGTLPKPENVGKITFLQKETTWRIQATPDILIRLKRLFPQAHQTHSRELLLKETPEINEDIEWITNRYPFDFEKKSWRKLRKKNRTQRKENLELQVVLNQSSSLEFKLALPPREYQKQGAELALKKKRFLLGDQMGLGKTVTLLAALSYPHTRPAIIVPQAHLCEQWGDFLSKFLPQANWAIAKTRKPHSLPEGTDVFIIPYTKISGWEAHLAQNPPKTLILDEVQEIRHPSSQKHQAVKRLQTHCEFVWGASGTPITNYGGEIFHLIDTIYPNQLGTEEEFKKEWCSFSFQNNKLIVKEPEALGSFLRKQHLLLRRTRHDVQAELPKLTSSIQTIPYDTTLLQKEEEASLELAKIILQGKNFVERGQASRQLDLRLRQSTGVAKAPFVAEFVRLLLEDDTPTILCGWHRSVYDIWLEKLKDFQPILYTGSENPSQKQKTKEKFLNQESKLMIMSLRSGAGLDGLQNICSSIVFGELDWSKAIHDQCIFRIFRDGQDSPCTAYYLLADGGSDPIISQILGIKASQAEGIIDLFKGESPEEDNNKRIKLLAQRLLNTHRKTKLKNSCQNPPNNPKN